MLYRGICKIRGKKPTSKERKKMLRTATTTTQPTTNIIYIHIYIYIRSWLHSIIFTYMRAPIQKTSNWKIKRARRSPSRSSASWLKWRRAATRRTPCIESRACVDTERRNFRLVRLVRSTTATTWRKLNATSTRRARMRVEKGRKKKKKEKKNRSSLRPWRYISLSFSFSRCLGSCSKFSFRKMDRRGKKLEYWRKRILEREEKNCNTDRASSLAIICRSTDIFTVGKGGVLLSLGADGQRPACPGLVLVENCAFREEKRKTFSKIDLSLENLFEILP